MVYESQKYPKALSLVRAEIRTHTKTLATRLHETTVRLKLTKRKFSRSERVSLLRTVPNNDAPSRQIVNLGSRVGRQVEAVGNSCGAATSADYGVTMRQIEVTSCPLRL
ncbi:hypothetical protein J6590_046667 [Homalodisca vitripennis]|nr:hypothetical protein J6590_046667 [Homalodisca vitripennis]